MLALPADGMNRWLIDGELREMPMTVRNSRHSEIMITIGAILWQWLRQQPQPRGKVLGGEAGIILSRNPDTTVGVDVAYISAETVAAQSGNSTLIEGVPVLVVEIGSPSDRLEEINEKNAKYRRAGVPLVWIVNPYDQTVVVHRLGAKPQLFNTDQEFAAEPHLPGFRVPVAELFAGCLAPAHPMEQTHDGDKSAMDRRGSRFGCDLLGWSVHHAVRNGRSCRGGRGQERAGHHRHQKAISRNGLAARSMRRSRKSARRPI